MKGGTLEVKPDAGDNGDEGKDGDRREVVARRSKSREEAGHPREVEKVREGSGMLNGKRKKKSGEPKRAEEIKKKKSGEFRDRHDTWRHQESSKLPFHVFYRCKTRKKLEVFI